MPGAGCLLKGLFEKDNLLGCLGIAMSKVTEATLHPSGGNQGAGVVPVGWEDLDVKAHPFSSTRRCFVSPHPKEVNLILNPLSHSLLLLSNRISRCIAQHPL